VRLSSNQPKELSDLFMFSPKTTCRRLPVSLVGIVVLQSLTVAAEPLRYNRDIRPLLSDKCFFCHGPDPNHREADLRLDVEVSAHDWVIEAGEAEESELWRRITSDDPEVQMPPPDSGKALSPEQIRTLRQWINEGARYEDHWSFVAPTRSQLPKPNRDDWVRNPIDAFILSRLESEGLSPSPEADKATLIRRLTLDLTGLPPTPEEVDAFTSNPSPAAYEELVDRLLQSERYGERMAQEWLDAARYADTMGYQADWERYQWRWRSWVIDAYNRNLPFDQFTIEQLAGDLLPDPTTEQLIATGFNRNHRINDEGGIIPEEYLVEYVVDRVETTSATWMGLTMGCARCHDHKFDPFSQVDFYRLFAIFNGVPEKGKEGRLGYATPYLRVAVRGKDEEYQAIKQRVAECEATLTEQVANLDSSREAWIQKTTEELGSAADPWHVVEPIDVDAVGAVNFESLGDGSYLATGDNLTNPTYVVQLKPGEGRITGIRLEALTHDSLSGGRLSSGNGNVILTDFTVEKTNPDSDNRQPLKIDRAVADYAQSGFPVTQAIDKDQASGWAVDGHRKKENRTAIFSFAKPVELKNDDMLTVRLDHGSKYPRREIGRFRLSVTSMKDPDFKSTLGLPADVVKAIRTKPERRKAKQKARLTEYHASIAEETKGIRKELKQARKDLKQFEQDSTTYVMVMKEMDQPRETHVLNRGVYNQPGQVVKAAVPAAVLGDLPPGASRNRLGLAQWLVSGEHPLTARVIVNRYWAMLFGDGLVRTPEDFGLQGAYPSHPDLLDWLATEYPRLKWNTKELLKLMVTSATYRQSSEFPPQLRESDPNNVLLARMSRLRLPAEMIRDQALFASGLLVEKIGGPSVKPYQPVGLWSELSFQSKSRTTDFYVQGSGDDLYRRSLYTFWKRSVPPPTMATFDAPSREMCTLQRPRTNTPLQALALMNDTTYVEASRALATRAMNEAGDDTRSRIVFAFRSLLGREPDEKEVATLAGGVETRTVYFRQNPSAAEKLITVGNSKPDRSLDPIELATLTTCVMNILNLDETIDRE
jgi:hypothetical protein